MPKKITRELLARINTGFKALFQGAFDGASGDWKQIAEHVKSTAQIETYTWLGAIPGMREWIGERFVKKLDRAAYVLRNRKFEATIGVAADDVADDQVGNYAPAFKGLGEAAANHPNELVFEALTKGFDLVCYDGQNFFDTDHPVVVDGEETSVSNMQAGAGPAWFLLCTQKSVKPLVYQDRETPELVEKTDPKSSDAVFMTDQYLYGAKSRGAAGHTYWQLAFGSKADLTPENYEAARTAMMSLKDDEGKSLNIVPNLLVVGPALEGKAKKIVQASKLANGADNLNQGTAEMLMSTYLA